MVYSFTKPAAGVASQSGPKVNEFPIVRTILRIIPILLLAACGALLQPAGVLPWQGALIGLTLGILILAAENQLGKVSLQKIIGAVVGSLFGILAACLISLVLGAALSKDVAPFVQISILLSLGYCGLSVGATKGEMLNLGALGGLFGSETTSQHFSKILDTSVIIDGRIADLSETGFLEGSIVIPQFVLRELQMVADSADSNKRNRGRRGLDILQRIQNNPKLKVQIVHDDFPNVKDVDMKLVELGKLYRCKVVTNDFNLNKVAQLHGVGVLNINELANALRPIVLPGEIMRVFILKEGKESSQGVAYLDDGTMVVVDNARRQISRTVDITVTSVLQTTAGKMIFGRYEDRNIQQATQAAASH